MIPFLVQIVICATSEENAIFASANNLRTDTKRKVRGCKRQFLTTKRAAVKYYVNNVSFLDEKADNFVTKDMIVHLSQKCHFYSPGSKSNLICKIRLNIFFSYRDCKKS